MNRITDPELAEFFKEKAELVRGWMIIISLASLGVAVYTHRYAPLFGMVFTLLLGALLLEFKRRLVRFGIDRLFPYEHEAFGRWKEKRHASVAH